MWANFISLSAYLGPGLARNILNDSLAKGKLLCYTSSKAWKRGKTMGVVTSKAKVTENAITI